MVNSQNNQLYLVITEDNKVYSFWQTITCDKIYFKYGNSSEEKDEYTEGQEELEQNLQKQAKLEPKKRMP
ncbi:30356_t:CDS:2 [Gigaspora margarita]|uniref:30356_t:CDS:1 n=1 Tax=Gigaspora margarita TaxID=4874 RepID=A0ABN7VIR3_GIGMA|nr:30356_t:CDS:2 [Gigaspora margarita]